MKKVFCLISVICISIAFSGSAQRLDRFGAETGSEDRDGFIHRNGYTGIVSYYGYIKPGSVPDDMRDGKSLYYLYFYLNDSLPEIGARIIAPVPRVIMPGKGDLVADNYYLNEKDKTHTFNTWLAIERAYSIKNFADITTKFDKTGWLQLSFNDDADEMFNKTNSLIRIINSAKKNIIAGLYRIVISTSGKEEVKGGFLIQLGSTSGLPGVRLTPKVEDLQVQ